MIPETPSSLSGVPRWMSQASAPGMRAVSAETSASLAITGMGTPPVTRADAFII